MTTLRSHDTLADMVGEIESALRGLAYLGTVHGAGYSDDPEYGFGCLASILAAKLAEVFCALNDWVMHDRDVSPPAGAHALPDTPSVTAEEGENLIALVRRLPPSAQQQLLRLLRSLGAVDRDTDPESPAPASEEG